MYSIWFLLAMAPAGVMYHVWRTRRSGRLQRTEVKPSIPEAPTALASVPESEETPHRMMRWIFIVEFMAILQKCSDLIVIDLRAEARSAPFCVPDRLVLPVAPNDLVEVLECLPSNKSVAFYDASNLSIFLITNSPCMEGSAPLYLLEGDLDLAEAL